MSVDTTVPPSRGQHHRGVVTGAQCDRVRLIAAADKPVDHGELADPGKRLGVAGRHRLLPMSASP